MRIVVTGAGGKLGGFLCREWAGGHEVLPLSRREADLRAVRALRGVLEALEFDALVNCAAMASPEACEDDPVGAQLVNAAAPETMAEVCARRGARLVHFSSDYVLDGEEEGLKDEAAPTRGLGYYGRSKLDGEERVLQACPDALVCRVSWIFGPGVPSFLQSVLSRARAGEPLEAVADKWSKPTAARSIARAVEELLPQRGTSGVLHLANEGGPESWWSYATKVLALACAAGLLERAPPVARTSLAAIPQLRAPRPVHTALTSRRVGALPKLPPWEELALDQLRALAAGECH